MLSGCRLQDIFDFAIQAPIESIDFIHDAANLNLSLSNAGIAGSFGLHIGATMQRHISQGLLPDSLFTKIILRTTAASDARMGGATLPAMTNLQTGIVISAASSREFADLAVAAMMFAVAAQLLLHAPGA